MANDFVFHSDRFVVLVMNFGLKLVLRLEEVTMVDLFGFHPVEQVVDHCQMFALVLVNQIGNPLCSH